MGLATTPVTLATGAFVTAAIWNTDVTDNMVALGLGTIMGTPTSQVGTGSPSIGATEIIDAGLGSYTFTAVAGRRYRAVLDGLGVSGNVAGDLVAVRIRNGGASTPTAASTLIAAAQIIVPVAGTSGQQSVPLANTFVPGAGVVTLGASTQRLVGTGAGTMVAIQGCPRQLYAVDVGPA